MLQRLSSAVAALSLSDAKAQLALLGDDSQDALVLACMAAAQEYVEDATGIYLGATDVLLTLRTWPDGAELPLPVWPARSVIVTYLDPAGAEVTLDASLYRLASTKPARLVRLGSVAWPQLLTAPDAVRVRFTAGFTAGAEAPSALTQAMKLLIGHFFEHREAVIVGAAAAVDSKALARGLDQLLNNHKLRADHSYGE